MLKRLVSLTIMVAACDGVLGLTPVVTSRDAPVIRPPDGPPDAPPIDALLGCIPTMFATHQLLTASQLQGVAVAQNVDAAIVVSSFSVGYISPVASGPVSSTSIMGQTWSNPAIAPTLQSGSSLFLFENGQPIQESLFGGSGTPPMQWSAPAASNGLGSAGDVPGTPAEIANGLQMVIQTASGIEEWSRPGGAASAWTPIHAYVPSDLGHLDGGRISSPSLTPDGRVLVYVYTVTTTSGIYFVRRPNPSEMFAATNARLATGTYVSPVLKQDCSEMWAVDAANGGQLVHFSH